MRLILLFFITVIFAQTLQATQLKGEQYAFLDLTSTFDFTTTIFDFIWKDVETVEKKPSTDFDDEYDDEISEDFDEEFADEVEKEMDPLSGYNRAMTTFNDFFYTKILFPVARGYEYIMPDDGRTMVANFFDNLAFPMRLVNNVLQLKVHNATEESGRFIINTTIGLLGFFDPAESFFNLQEHNEDFGQTLGYYGVGSGFHIVLPLSGPSNVRDSIGRVGDMLLNPFTYFFVYEHAAAKAVDYTNDATYMMDEYESLKKDAIDLYPMFKDIYRQSREKQIKE